MSTTLKNSTAIMSCCLTLSSIGCHVTRCFGGVAADATPSGMVSILGLDREKIESLCDQARGVGEVLQVANLLGPGNIVVSGHKSACAKVAELATAAGAMKTIPLSVAGAFHTPIMQPAEDRLAAALAGVQLR